MESTQQSNQPGAQGGMPGQNMQFIEEETKVSHEESKDMQAMSAYQVKQDDFFYKIKELNPPTKLQYIIEIPKLKKKYKI